MGISISRCRPSGLLLAALTMLPLVLVACSSPNIATATGPQPVSASDLATESTDPVTSAVADATAFGTPITVANNPMGTFIVLRDYAAANGDECKAYHLTSGEQPNEFHVICRGSDGWYPVKPLLVSSPITTPTFTP